MIYGNTHHKTECPVSTMDHRMDYHGPYCEIILSTAVFEDKNEVSVFFKSTWARRSDSVQRFRGSLNICTQRWIMCNISSYSMTMFLAMLVAWL